MTDIRRYYCCGCEPDEDHFCEHANKYVWEDREAAMEESGMGGVEPSPDEVRRLAYRQGFARGILYEHYRMQEVLGRYTDVDLDAPENQPPEDLGGDEPQEVVNP